MLGDLPEIAIGIIDDMPVRNMSLHCTTVFNSKRLNIERTMLLRERMTERYLIYPEYKKNNNHTKYVTESKVKVGCLPESLIKIPFNE